MKGRNPYVVFPRLRAKRNQNREVPLESQEQTWLFEWATKVPELSYMFAVPNGGYRTKSAGASMKRQGTKKGVPDIFLPLPKGNYHGMFIELKRLKGGDTSNFQKEYIEHLTNIGYYAVVCEGWIAAREEIMKYLKLK